MPGATVYPSGTYDAQVDPQKGRIRLDPNGNYTELDQYDGPYAEGRWVDDGQGNRIRVTNPDRLVYVRRFQAQMGGGTNQFGVIGLPTAQRPASGTLTYQGTSTGLIKRVLANDPLKVVESGFEGRSRITADITTGQGTMRVTDIVPHQSWGPKVTSIEAPFELNGRVFEEGDSQGVLVVPEGRQVTTRTAVYGAFYGPRAAEVGMSYAVSSSGPQTATQITGHATGKRTTP